MANYSKYILAVTLCLQPALSVSMTSATDTTTHEIQYVFGTVAALSYGAFFVSNYFKQDHETRNRRLLSGDIDKKMAKALMNTPEAQQLIKDVHADHQKRKQEFFHDNSRATVKDILIKTGFAKLLHDRCLLDHASRIIGFLALSEKTLDAQLLYREKLQMYERAGLRHGIVDEATKKAHAQHARRIALTRFLLAGTSCAGSVSLYSHLCKS